MIVSIYVVTIWELKGVVVYLGSICSDIFYIINIKYLFRGSRRYLLWKQLFWNFRTLISNFTLGNLFPVI